MSQVTKCDICDGIAEWDYPAYCNIYISGSVYLKETEEDTKKKKSDYPMTAPASHTYDICQKCFDKHLKNLLFK